MTVRGKANSINLPIHRRNRVTVKNKKSVYKAHKQIAILFTLLFGLISLPSWAVGTVDIAEITPVTVTVLPNTSQRFDFSAQNNTAAVLTNYTVKLAYIDGANVSNLSVSPSAKSFKIDTRKKVISIQMV